MLVLYTKQNMEFISVTPLQDVQNTSTPLQDVQNTSTQLQDVQNTSTPLQDVYDITYTINTSSELNNEVQEEYDNEFDLEEYIEICRQNAIDDNYYSDSDTDESDTNSK